MSNILIIDDDEAIRDLYRTLISRLDHQFYSAGSLEEGFALLDKHLIDIVFLDIALPDGNGLDALPQIKQNRSSPEVIIITGEGSVEGAELAIKNGAWTYIEKPLSTKEIILQLDRTAEYHEKKMMGARPAVLNTDGIVGKSEELRQVFKSVAQCAKSDANVHIFGHTGTGKELIANMIHKNSDRVGGPFIVVDCTVLPEQLVESTLFGYEKGAFTGANEAREGLIKCAHQGTLFLDEIGELSLPVQKSLLRVLQDRQFRPVGSNEIIHSNFRLISATNKNLDELVQGGGFRDDLLFRLRTVAIELPSLKQRKSDIKELVFHYVHELCEKNNLGPKGFNPDFLLLLEAYDWPGNVRELISVLEMALLAEPQNPILYPVHLPENIRINYIKSISFKEEIEPSENEIRLAEIPKEIMLDGKDVRSPLIPLKEFRKKCYHELEHQYLKQLMQTAQKDIQQACKISGLKKARLYELMRKHGINRESI